MFLSTEVVESLDEVVESLDEVVESLDDTIESLTRITVLHRDEQSIVQTQLSPAHVLSYFKGLQHDDDTPPNHFYLIVPSSAFSSMEPVLKNIQNVLKKAMQKKRSPPVKKAKNPNPKKRKLSPPTTQNLVDSVLAAHVSGADLDSLKCSRQKLMKRAKTSASAMSEVLALIAMGAVPVSTAGEHIIPYLKRENFASLVKGLYQPTGSKLFQECLKKLAGFYISAQTMLPKLPRVAGFSKALLPPGHFVLMKDSQTDSILLVFAITDPVLVGNLPMEVRILSSQKALVTEMLKDLTQPVAKPTHNSRLPQLQMSTQQYEKASAKMSLLVSMFGDDIGRHMVKKYLHYQYQMTDNAWDFLLKLPLSLWSLPRILQAIRFARINNKGDVKIKLITQKMCLEFKPVVLVQANTS